MFKLKRLTFRDEKLIGRCGSILLSGILALGGYMANADVVFSPTSRSFGAEGGSYRISVGAEEGTDMDGYWGASPMVSWIKLKSSSGHFAGHGRGSSDDFLEYTVEENASGVSRIGTIKIFPGGKYYTVIQSSEYATITADSLFFTSDGGESKIRIDLEKDEYLWTATSGRDFAALSATNGCGSTELVVRVPKYDSSHSRGYRRAKIVVCGREFEVAQSIQTIAVAPQVVQCDPLGDIVELAVRPYFGLSGAERLASNFNWRVSSSCDWLSVQGELSRTGWQTLQVVVPPNDSNVSRTGVLRFQRTPNAAGENKDYDEVTEVTFVQRFGKAADIMVSPSSASVGSEGGSGLATVTSASGTRWKAESSCGWIALPDGVSQGAGTLEWNVGANEGVTPRTATVFVRACQTGEELSDADLMADLDLWITEESSLEGNSNRAFERPFSSRFDGTFENALGGDAFPRHPSSAFSFAFSFESAVRGCTNALFRLGNRLGLFVDETDRLVVQVARDGKLVDEVIRTDFVLPWIECSYTIVVRQDESGHIAVFGAQRDTPLARIAEFDCGKILPFDETEVKAAQLVLGSALDKSLGKMVDGRVLDVRLWARALSDMECGYADIFRDYAVYTAPVKDVEFPTCSYFPMDGNLLGGRNGFILGGYGSTLVHTNGLIGVLNRLGVENRAARAENRYDITRFSELFGGHCITNDNRRWPDEGICVPPGRSASGSSYGGTGSGYGYFCKHGWNSDDYFPYPMVATGVCETNATYALWVRVDAYPDVRKKEIELMSRRRPISDDRGVVLDRDNGVIALSLNTEGRLRLSGSGIEERNSEVALSQGVWHQIVLVGRARESVALYVDGEMWFETPSTMTLGYLPPVDRRCYCWGNDNPKKGAIEYATFSVGEFGGAVDDMAFYHDALTGEQVRHLYEKSFLRTAGEVSAGGLRVTQSAAALTVSETTVNACADGEICEIAVSTPDYVCWQALSDSEWVVVSGNAAGRGSATVGLIVAPNDDVETRTAIVVIAGREVEIVQAGRSATVDFPIAEISSEENSWGVSVQTGDNTSWKVVSDSTWLRSDLTRGKGNKSFALRATRNPGAARTAHVTIAGQTFTVTQAAHWLVVDPQSYEYECLGVQGVVSVSAAAKSAWSATSSASWLMLGTESGCGNGTVDFVLSDNSSGADRVGTITIGDMVVTVTQLVTRALSAPRVSGGGSVTGTLDHGYGTTSRLVGEAVSGWIFDHWEYAYRDTATGLLTTKNSAVSVIYVKANEYQGLTAYFSRRKVTNPKTENIVGALRLSWTPASWAVKYVIYRSPGSTRPEEPLDETSEAVFDDTSAVLDTDYNYWIEAVGADGSSSVTGPISGVRQTFDLGQPVIVGPRIVYAGETREYLAGTLWSDGSFRSRTKLDPLYEWFSSPDWNRYAYITTDDVHLPVGKLVVNAGATGVVVRVALQLKHDSDTRSTTMPVTIVPRYSTDGLGVLMFDMRLESSESSADAFIAMTNGVEVARVTGRETKTVIVECDSLEARTFSWKTLTTAYAPYGVVTNLVWRPAPATVTLTFDAQGGTCETTSMTGTPGEAVGPLPTPVRAGYVFAGWYREASEGGAGFAAGSCAPVCSCTLVAHWTVATYEVTFDLGSHAECVAGGALTQRVAHASAAVAPTLRLKPGYAFNGWSEDFDSVTGPLAVAATYSPIPYAIVYSQTRGAANANPATYTVEDALEFAPLADVPGWQFLGWSPTGLKRGTTGEQTVTAQWKPVMCRIGSSDGLSQEFAWGETVTLTCDACVTNGWTNLVCTGWVGTGDVPASGNAPSATFTVKDGGAIRWLYETNYWFTARAGTGGKVSRAAGPDGLDLDGCWVAAGTAVAVTAIADEGHHFWRWNDAVDATTTTDATWSGVIEAPKVLSAVFSDTWTVIFDLGASGERTGGGELLQEVRNGESAIAPTVRVATGYEFVGWSQSFEAISADVLVQAMYKPIVYELNYVDAKGCANANPLTYTVEDAVRFSSLTNPPGWMFKGWQPDAIVRGTTGDLTVQATWEQLRYAVDVQGEVDGTCVYGQTVMASTFASVTNGFTNLVCCGWVGTGDVPATGTGTQVTFVVTQPSSLRWQYETNYYVRVDGDGHGTIRVIDADDRSCASEGWYSDGTILRVSAEPASGYLFSQWTDVETGMPVGTSARIDLSVDRPRLVRADFSPISYTLRVAVREGVGTVDDLTLRYGEECVIPTDTISRDGYVLAGWTTDADGTEVEFAPGAAISNLTDRAGSTVKVYALWTPYSYQVHFHPNLSGVEGEMKPQTFVYGVEQPLATNCFVRSGFVFCGWSVRGEILADGASVVNPGWYDGFQDFDRSTGGKFGVELLGTWKRVFTFDKNGGTGGTDSICIALGEDFPDIEPPTRAGYRFDGYEWTDDRSLLYWGEGKTYQTCYSHYFVREATLSAIWSKDNSTYRVHYDLGEGGRSSGGNPQVYHVWDEDILLEDPIPKEGFRFVGWSPTNVIPQFSTGDKTFTANWIKLKAVRVTYDLGCDDAYRQYACYPLDRQEILSAYEGDRVDELLMPSRDGYSFEGWFTASEGGEKFAAGFEIDEDMTLYARWKPNTYVVRFDGSGATGTMPDQGFVYGEEQTLRSNAFLRPGYRFRDWLDNRYLPSRSYPDGASVKNLTGVDGGVVELHAVWEPLYNWIRTQGNGGEGEDLSTFARGDWPYPLGASYSREGYEQVGWALEPDGKAVFSTAVLPGEIIGLVGGMTDEDLDNAIAEGYRGVFLYAVWEPIQYTVRFEANGGIGTMSPLEMTYGVAYALPPCSFVKEGLEFAGWDLFLYDWSFVARDFEDGEVVSNIVPWAKLDYGDHQVAASPRLVARWRKITCPVTIGDGEPDRYEYGSTVVLRAPGTGYQDDGSYVTCIGWTDGTGDIPPTGTGDSVSITVTQSSSIKWLYSTEYLICVNSDFGDDVPYDDPVAFFASAYIRERSGGGAYSAFDYFNRGETATLVAPVGVAAEYGLGFVGWVDRVSYEPIRPQEGIRFESDAESGCERLVIEDISRGWDVQALYETMSSVVVFDLGDHGHRTGGGELEQTVEWNGRAIAPKVTADPAYKFTGWSRSFDHVKGDLTVVAQYEKIATQIGVAYVDGCDESCGTVSGGKTVKTGTKVTVKATPAKGYVFTGWFVDCEGMSPVSGDADYRTASYSVVSTGEDLTLYARFAPASSDLPCIFIGEEFGFDPEIEFARNVPIEPIVLPVGAPSLPTVKVTGLPSGLKFTAKALDVKATKSAAAAHYEANTVYGTPTKSGVYVVTVTATSASKKSESKTVKLVVRAPGEALIDADWDSALGKVTGMGICAPGKSLTLKATASKNHVFAGWYQDAAFTIPAEGKVDYRTASYPVGAKGEDVALHARFVPTDLDIPAIPIGGASELAEEMEFVRNKAIDPLVLPIASISLPTVKVTGLPTGLKFTAKALDVKASKSAAAAHYEANTVYGTPTKSGVYVVTVTATSASKKSESKTVKLVVRAPGEALIDADWDSALGKVTGMGICAPGKSLTLKATAGKNHVFAGWYQDAAFTIPAEGKVDYRTASFAVVDNGWDQKLYARFVPAAADQVVGAVVAGSYDLNGPWTKKLDVDSLSLPSVTVKGLPSGLKFDAKTLTIAGTPTKPGTYMVTLSLKNVTVKKSVTQTFVINVANIESAYLVDVNYAKNAYIYHGGVSVGWNIGACARDGYAISGIKGLPTGLKYNAKTGRIEGVPTKAGSFTATITLKNGKQTSLATVSMTVNAIDAWAYGTFNGGSPSNQVQLTVTSTGKLSGKLFEDGQTYSLVANAYSAYDASASNYRAEVTASWSYKKGTETVKTNEVWTIFVSADTVGGVVDADRFCAWQNVWAQKAWNGFGTSFFGKSGTVQTLTGEMYSLGVGESVALTIKPNGTVTVKGVFDTGTVNRQGKPVYYSASGSAVVCATSKDPFVGLIFVYFAPNAGKSFDGYVHVVSIDEQ